MMYKKSGKSFGALNNLSYLCKIKKQMTMEEKKPYPMIEEEEKGGLTAHEPTADVAYTYEGHVIPDGVDYARITDGVLQVTPDVEEEIAEVERGEVVSMAEFNKMFSRWL